MPHETSLLMLLALPGGMVLAGFYFTGLWFTVRNLSTAKHLSAIQLPVFRLILSFIIRLGIVLPGFYVLSDGRWQNMLLALSGFVLVRSVLILRFKPEHNGILSPLKIAEGTEVRSAGKGGRDHDHQY